MLPGPLEIDDTDEAAVRSQLKTLFERLHDLVSDVLSEIDQPELRRQIRHVAFQSTEALPKRSSRPTVVIHHLVEQLFLSYDPDGDSLDQVLRAAVIAMEYYDIVDDVIDGDVRAGHELDVLVTNELLFPLFVRHIGRLGQPATDYWSERAVRTVGSLVVEYSSEPSAETYRTLVDRQSYLFGSMTGLGAVAAGAGQADVERAEQIGRTYFTYDQFRLDLRQYEGGDDDPWNLWRLCGDDEATGMIVAQRAEFERLIEPLPDDRRRLLRPLVATDIESYRASFR
ncbi:hypothetical protein [Halovivax cerinus]|uniref:Geranylgeranyl pyrophosphate synthase n=1 Tax=Halovivax cerinus TaxID=1487865 RepID=A0ABD5NLS5_9EURY|nr:hypothetical protein [Halovivax cerinus]